VGKVKEGGVGVGRRGEGEEGGCVGEGLIFCKVKKLLVTLECIAHQISL